MDRDEFIAQEVAEIEKKLREYCKSYEYPVVIVRIVSESLPLNDSEWDAILSAEEWAPMRRDVLNLIRKEGSYPIRSRRVYGFWYGESTTINKHLKKHRLPFYLWSSDGLIRIGRVRI